MQVLSERLAQDPLAPEVPDALIQAAHQASREITDPDRARIAFETLAPLLEKFRPNQEFTLACGLLAEKQRQTQGMLDLWQDLSNIYPNDVTPLRMMMRWYRRQRRTDEGIDRIQRLYPEAHSDLEQAEKAIIGFAELKAHDEIDQLMETILKLHPSARAIRMRYIKVLNQQSRYLDAKAIADTVLEPHKMGQSSIDLLNLVHRRAHKMAQMYSSDVSNVFEKIIETLPPVQSMESSALGGILFFTGQLGAGGAERQLTRLAQAFQDRYQNGELAGGYALTAPIDVAVRHANPSSGADFFLPVLQEARIRTSLLSEMADVELHDLQGVSPVILSLLELLPDDVFEHTCKLIPYFQNRKTQVAYLWQDGAILSAAIAALIAGVPRIITSFRGLPPNLRPNLSRPEMGPLYRLLAQLNHVTFSANSASTARAYEQWLDMSQGTIAVIPNASPPVLPDGSKEDDELWSAIENKSPNCVKTVVGVFRFDENKRPELWVEAAAQYVNRHSDTRFVIVGGGYLQAACAKRIAELGLRNRIFLVGLQSNVGFFLHKADMVMHLARMEGLPNVLIEAHLAGVPVLATPAGGTSEVVIQGETGTILPDAENPRVSDIYMGLFNLLADLDRLSQMGQNAKASASSRFLIDHVVDQTAQLFANRKDI